MSQDKTQLSSLPAGSIELVHGAGDASHAVIWLHGLGATANDFPSIVPELGLDAKRPVRFVFPQAPNRPITINGGMNMPGWYDIKGMNIEDKQDRAGLSESQTMVESLVDDLIESGIPSQNIIIAGFSQGGAVSYFSVVRSQRKLAGLLTMSTYLPFDEQTLEEQSGVNIDTPIFASHGTHDPVVPTALGDMSVKRLSELGYSIKWQTYPMGHQVVMEQIRHIGEWINSVYDDR